MPCNLSKVFILLFIAVMSTCMLSCCGQNSTAQASAQSASSASGVLPTLEPAESVSAGLENASTLTSDTSATSSSKSAVQTQSSSMGNADNAAVSEEKNDAENNQTVCTAGIEYKFDTLNLTAVSQVDANIAAAIDSTHIGQDGQAEIGWYVAFTDMSVTNLSSTAQYMMLNSVSITRVDGEPVMGCTMSMRYYSEGDSTSKQYFGVSLKSGETKKATVGFLISKERLGDGQISFSVNPDGVWPGNDNTRLIPITLAYE